MKYCLVIPDGMADYPIEQLGGKTPMEAANTPNMDRVALLGRLGTMQTVPEGMSPGSDVAIMSVLGINPAECYSGRAPLEAASMDIELGSDAVAFRCNLVTVHDGVMVDFSAGHISSAEGKALIDSIDQRLGTREVSFHPGVSYRHLMVYRGSKELSPTCTPPHDIIGQKIDQYLPTGPGSEILCDLMTRSRSILDHHDVNTVRIDHGERPATMIWLWGGGKAPTIRPFAEQFGLRGAVVAAVDLVKGIGKYLGFQRIYVEGATGYLDTNYAGKGRAAISALEEYDFVVVHIEAPDEAGHNGSVSDKIRAIEEIDAKIVGPILEALLDKTEFRILIAPDHPTPIAVRTHTSDPVPFAMCGTGILPVHELPFSERAAAGTGLRFEHAHELMPYFLRA